MTQKSTPLCLQITIVYWTMNLICFMSMNLIRLDIFTRLFIGCTPLRGDSGVTPGFPLEIIEFHLEKFILIKRKSKCDYEIST